MITLCLHDYSKKFIGLTASANLPGIDSTFRWTFNAKCHYCSGWDPWSLIL